MLKRIIVLLCTLLMFTSCTSSVKEDEIVQSPDEQTEQEISIVPNYQLSKDDYKMILPFRPSEARGVITAQVANRLDIDEMEEGLRRHSTATFDPEKYLFEEGQYLTASIVREWIDDLNPERPEDGASKKEHQENPRVLSHVLEQNYLKRTESNSVELVGVSIGLALKSVYRYQTIKDGPYYYEEISEQAMLKKGKEMAQIVLERLREIEGLETVPIMIALYREQERSSPVPGTFIAKSTVGKSDMVLGKWEALDEEYILFPSNDARKNHFDDYEIVNGFGNNIVNYFPNYVGVVGKGFYLNDELQTLSLEIPIEFYGSAEVVGFSQYVYGLVKDMFPSYYDLEIKIVSSDKVESLLYRGADEEDPVVHIFH